MRLKPLNLTAKDSAKNKKISAAIIKDEPQTF